MIHHGYSMLYLAGHPCQVPNVAERLAASLGSLAEAKHGLGFGWGGCVKIRVVCLFE